MSIIKTKMCLDVVFGSCCSPGMTVDAHIKHEVNFLFFFRFFQRQEDGYLFLPHLDAVNLNAPSPHSVTVMKNMVAAAYFNRLSAWKSKLCLAGMASITVPESSVRYAGRVTTILSHPYLSPSFGVLVSLACSAKKHIFSSALFSLQVFSQPNVCLWWTGPVGGACRSAGSVNNFACVSQILFLDKVRVSFILEIS